MLTISGSVRYHGNELVGLSPKEWRGIRGRGIAMIFQEPMTSLNPTFSIGFQIGEVLRLHRGLNRHQARDRSVELLDMVGLGPHLASRYPHEFSGGQRQRLEIARALVSEPAMLLADEPTASLDKESGREVVERMKVLAKEHGTTILLVEQNARLALSIADHGYVMENGRIVLDDSVDKIKENADVKEFYLGLTEVGKKKSYRDVKHYKRRKRWLT